MVRTFDRRAWIGLAAWFVVCLAGGARADDEAPEPASDGAERAAAARRVIEQAVSGPPAAEPEPRTPPAAPPEAAGPTADLAIAKLSAEVAAKQLEARRAAQKSPADALALLDTLAARVAEAGLPADARGQLERRIERTRRDIEETTGKRRAEIALDRKNAAVEAQIDRERSRKVEVDERLAMLVEEYNVLIDERRFLEAEAVAKKAAQLAPENTVVRQLLAQSRMVRRLSTQRSLDETKQAAYLEDAEDTERLGAPFTGPIAFPETKNWADLTKNRRRLEAEGRSRGSAAEAEIHKSLSVKVRAAHRNAPLSAVLDDLARQADVPIHLDMIGLENEAVRSDTPVTISLDQPISLKSALKLLLEPLHLDFTIRDEVLKVTSPKLVKGQYYSVSYQVADLVVPIPNFSSDGLGITGALRDGYSRIPTRNALSVETGPPPAGINAADAAASSAPLNPAALAQFQGGMGGPRSGGSVPSIPFGAPNVGGSQADFQSLIDLIQNTVAPQTWNTLGGQGAIQPFSTNLSLVISQTQEVHEEIADLLDQLRRLQDLQVTIEVRFIRLNDTFFERIGVDFDFNIQSNVNDPLNITAIPTQSNSSTNPISQGIQSAPGGRSQVVGLDNTGNPGVALSPLASQFVTSPSQTTGQGNIPGYARNHYSIPFRQNSFGAASVPALPGLPDPTSSAANFGFAILSDIEAYFLIQAAQGNTRSNVMQAPKVTLFNGQNAFVSDTTQRPFVTSVIPVVGDFAAAQQPVITVLSEGTAVNLQAVVSSDHRFVRLTLIPFFSQIGKVQEFQFEGSRSTKTKSSDEKSGVDGQANAVATNVNAGLTTGIKSAAEQEVKSSGTTIQLPEFVFTTVQTTVSVPDGGTVLLGGIKRLREGRNEYGVPILSKIPYINRLFKNVGLGRVTDSLMLMVTPRIIIQEEEEEKLLGSSKP